MNSEEKIVNLSENDRQSIIICQIVISYDLLRSIRITSVYIYIYIYFVKYLFSCLYIAIFENKRQ